MNTFKRKALASAVLGTLGVVGSAHAIYQDPTNLGEALVYPYYTVNNDPAGNPFNTFISVINTTSAVKVVKVRFREGKASAEVFDFNLYLSPNDMWTGAVIPTSTDVTSPAALISADLSCINPGPIGLVGQQFRNYQYTGLAADLLPGTLDRTREGYVEMFEMGVLPAATTYAAAATHVQPGAPTCTGLTGLVISTVGSALTAPTGGLMGTGTIINVTSGRDTMYNANAFGAWVVGGSQYSDIGNDLPNFSATNPATSIVVSTPNVATVIPSVYFSTWVDSPIAGLGLAGSKAASATMMHADVINEYILDAATASATDWVFTFPTKRLFVSQVTAVAPFTASLGANGACEVIDLTFFNREEGTSSAPPGSFSPLPPGAAANTLCWESNILSFRNGTSTAPSTPATPSLVLGSANVTTVGVTNTYQNGWASVHFSGVNASSVGLVSAATGSTSTPVGGVAVGGAQTFHGLPVVGFMVRTFTNGTLHCGAASCLGNYLGSASHGYRNLIAP